MQIISKRHAAACGASLFAIALAAGASAGPKPLPHTKPAMAAPRSLLPPAKLMPNAAAGLAKPYGGTPIDVTNYHYDNYRTGWNPTETDLTPSSVSSGKFGLLATLKVDGNVFAQPMLVHAFVMPDGTTHDVLIVATGHDSVYAFDAQTYAVLWQVSLGTAQSSNDVQCGDVVPEYGISGTPVIVRTGANAATIYLVAATEPSSQQFLTQLHALSVGTGLDVTTPVTIAPSATLSGGLTVNFDPKNQWNRAGLAYANGSIYIGIGSHCDANPNNISGWLLRYGTDLTSQAAFHTINTRGGYELASIWMTGFAPAADPSGNLFVVTGNGNYQGGGADDWGESALKLSADLSKVESRFTPKAYKTFNDDDTDFGSGGIMLLPHIAKQTGPKLAVAMGKDATMYLLNQAKMGNLKAHDAGALQAIRLAGSGDGLWGGPAYFDGPAGPTVFEQINDDLLRAFAVTTGTTPSMAQAAQGTTQAGYGGSLPIVSSNGATANTGVVWLIRRSLPVELEAYDAGTLGAPLYVANAGNWSNTSQSNPFLTPMEANGRVYVPAYKTVDVFGLTP